MIHQLLTATCEHKRATSEALLWASTKSPSGEGLSKHIRSPTRVGKF